jgi:hypothetical protein
VSYDPAIDRLVRPLLEAIFLPHILFVPNFKHFSDPVRLSDSDEYHRLWLILFNKNPILMCAKLWIS